MTSRIIITMSLAFLLLSGCASMSPRKLSWNNSRSKSKADSKTASKDGKEKDSTIASRSKSKTSTEKNTPKKDDTKTASANYGDRKPKQSSAVTAGLEKAMQADNKASAAEERAQAARKQVALAEQKHMSDDALRAEDEAKRADEDARKSYQDARLAYEKVLKQDAENPTALHRLAIIADKQERFEDAERLYQQVLRLKPNDPSVLSDLGYSYTLQNKSAEAEKTFRSILKNNPDHRFAQGNLGHLLAKRAQATGNRADYDEAFKCFRKAGGEQMAQAEMADLFPNGPPANLAQKKNDAQKNDPQKNNSANPFLDSQPENNSQGNNPIAGNNPVAQKNLAQNNPVQKQPTPPQNGNQVVWGELRDEFAKIDNPPSETQQRTVTIPTTPQQNIARNNPTQNNLTQNPLTQTVAVQNPPSNFQQNAARQPDFNTQTTAQPPRQEEVPWDTIVANAPPQNAPANNSRQFAQNPNQPQQSQQNQSLRNLNMTPQVDTRQPMQAMAPLQSNVGIVDSTQQQPWTMTPAQGNVPTSSGWDDAQREAAQMSMTTMFPMSDSTGRVLPQTGFPNSGSPLPNQNGFDPNQGPSMAPQLNRAAPTRPNPNFEYESHQSMPMTNATGGQYGTPPGVNPNIVQGLTGLPGMQPNQNPNATMTGVEQFEAELQAAPQGNAQAPYYPQSRVGQPIQGDQPTIRPASAVYPQ
ncbi:MAG: tetratricopeptide repeat protein [Planctomycetales bacterium]